MNRSAIVLSMLTAVACGTSVTSGTSGTTAFSNAGSNAGIGSGGVATSVGSLGAVGTSGGTTGAGSTTSAAGTSSGHTATSQSATSAGSTTTTAGTTVTATATAVGTTAAATTGTATASATATATATGTTGTGTTATATGTTGPVTATAVGTTGSGTTGTIGTAVSTGSGVSSTSTSSTSGTTGAAIVYCNGIQLTDSANATAYLATFPKSDNIRLNCDHAFDPLLDAGATLGGLAGVLDRNTFASVGTIYTVWPASCADLDAGAAPTPGPTVTDGGTTVAAALTAALGGTAVIPGPVYGVVTFLTAPYVDDTGPHSGTMWFQDQVDNGFPTPGSGVSIYFPSASANDAGITAVGLYPPAGTNLGDAVALTNLTWSPYVAAGNTTGLAQNQFEFGPTATLTDLGPGTLPPAVPLTGAELTDAGAAYMGMRVIQTDGPDTVVNSCPAALQSGG